MSKGFIQLGLPPVKITTMQYVPVVDRNQIPLMPTTPMRAARWIKSGKATPFWRKGIFCVRLNEEPSNKQTQPIAVGIDPGSKREGYTVKSKAHTYLNQQFHAVDWVSDAEEASTNARRTRRSRKTPYRKDRKNRKYGGVPPSTKARWQFKIRVVKVLIALFPISDIGIEDIKAVTKKGCKTWNSSFSPLEVGKEWCYHELEKLAPVTKYSGYNDTYLTREALGLKKTKDKLSSKFSAHCVDSWVLAFLLVGGNTVPDNTLVMQCKPIRLYRRQLHVFLPTKGNYRKPRGGSMSQGLKRGGIVKHPKWGKCYIGGQDLKNLRVSLHSLATGERLTRWVKPADCRFLAYNSWRVIPNVT